LVRDRLGIKPLYWRSMNGRVVFGSELAAVRAALPSPPVIDPEAVNALTLLAYVPAPRSIWQGVSKVMPGTMVTLRPGREPAVEAYWSLAEVAARGIEAPFALTDEAAVDLFSRLLTNAVRDQMVSDVPGGAFLSRSAERRVGRGGGSEGPPG